MQGRKRRPVNLRSQPRPLPGLEPQVLPQCVRHHENVGKQDRAVESEATQRLQSHFRGCFAVVHQVEESALFGTQRPIFGKVPPGLPHEPQRGDGLAGAAQGFEQRLGRRNLSQRRASTEKKIQRMKEVEVVGVGMLGFMPLSPNCQQLDVGRLTQALRFGFTYPRYPQAGDGTVGCRCSCGRIRGNVDGSRRLAACSGCASAYPHVAHSLVPLSHAAAPAPPVGLDGRDA